VDTESAWGVRELYVHPTTITDVGSDTLPGRAAHTAAALETFSLARENARQHLWMQPQHIRNAYYLLTTEKERWDHARQTLSVQVKDPPISLRVFFRLRKELCIPSQLQLEMAAIEKQTGGSFFVW
jgi:hypothetical protein